MMRTMYVSMVPHPVSFLHGKYFKVKAAYKTVHAQ